MLNVPLPLHEIPLPRLVQFEAQETAHHADIAFYPGRVRVVRLVKRPQACARRRREPGQREPFSRASPRVVYPAAAARLSRPDRAHSGGFRGFALVVVWW